MKKIITTLAIMACFGTIGTLGMAQPAKAHLNAIPISLSPEQQEAYLEIALTQDQQEAYLELVG